MTNSISSTAALQHHVRANSAADVMEREIFSLARAYIYEDRADISGAREREERLTESRVPRSSAELMIRERRGEEWEGEENY